MALFESQRTGGSGPGIPFSRVITFRSLDPERPVASNTVNQAIGPIHQGTDFRPGLGPGPAACRAGSWRSPAEAPNRMSRFAQQISCSLCPALPGAWRGLSLALGLLLLGGCALNQGAPERYAETYRLELAVQDPVLRPGEALVTRTELRNISGQPQAARLLGEESLEFFIVREGSPRKARRSFISSRYEKREEFVQLSPQQYLSRDFVFVNCTEKPGTYYIQALYNTEIAREGSDYSPLAVSEPVKYEVRGPRIFERGYADLITEEEAIRLAREELGRETVQEAASLIQNEAGFFDWWVLLSLDPLTMRQGERPERAYFVNPYLGFVRGEARADNHPGKSEEKRRLMPPKKRRDAPPHER